MLLHAAAPHHVAQGSNVQFEGRVWEGGLQGAADTRHLFPQHLLAALRQIYDLLLPSMLVSSSPTAMVRSREQAYAWRRTVTPLRWGTKTIQQG
jgi:hypothetical protein